MISSDLASVKMVHRPQDENENSVEIEFEKSQRINRRGSKYSYEIGFYCMSLVAIFFLFHLVYSVLGRSLRDRKCPTVTILKEKHPSEVELKRLDESDPLYALCGPCPRVTCPRCILTDDNCTCPDPADLIEPCPTIAATRTTCPPCPPPSSDSLLCQSSTSTLTSTEVLPTQTSNSDKYRVSNLCLARNCVIEASNLLEVMDVETINCTKFSRYICNKQAQTRLNKFQSQHDWFATSQESAIEAILEDILNREGKASSIIRDINDFQWSCIDASSIEGNGHQPLVDLVDAIRGWPLLDSGNECTKNFNLTNTLTTIHELGALDSSLFSTKINLSRRISSDLIISISYPTLGMKDPAKYSNKYADLYYELMVETASRLGGDRQNSSEYSRKVLKFETDLAKLVENYSESMPGNLTITEMTSLFPSIEWIKFLRGYARYNITGSEKIAVENIDFIRELSSLIVETDRRVTCYYISWRVILDLMPRLNNDWRQLYYEKMDINESRTRGELCDLQVVEYFSNVLPILYYREHSELLETVQFLKLMNNSIEQGLRILSNFLNNDESRSKAEERLKAFGDYVNGIHRFINSSLVDEMYKKINMKGESYFLNILELNKFARRIQIEALNCGDPSFVDYVGPGISQPSEQRFFIEHFLSILAMVTRKPYITDINYLNYSSIGYRLVHHLLNLLFRPSRVTFGVDNEQREMEEIELNDVEMNGNCKIADDFFYGSPQTKKNLTLDFLSTTITEKAFSSENKLSNSDYYLPGFKYEGDQLFYINLARTFCMANMKNLEELNANSTGDRLSVILWTIQSFKRSFECLDNDEFKCFRRN